MSEQSFEWEQFARMMLYRGGMRSTGDTHVEFSRAPVPGGWFILTVVKGDMDGVTTSFYPDPDHVWDGKSVPLDRLHAAVHA